MGNEVVCHNARDSIGPLTQILASSSHNLSSLCTTWHAHLQSLPCDGMMPSTPEVELQLEVVNGTGAAVQESHAEVEEQPEAHNQSENTSIYPPSALLALVLIALYIRENYDTSVFLQSVEYIFRQPCMNATTFYCGLVDWVFGHGHLIMLILQSTATFSAFAWFVLPNVSLFIQSNPSFCKGSSTAPTKLCELRSLTSSIPSASKSQMLLRSPSQGSSRMHVHYTGRARGLGRTKQWPST